MPGNEQEAGSKGRGKNIKGAGRPLPPEDNGCRKQTERLAVQDMFDLAQSTISHHIKQLVDAGLLIAEKDGRQARYEVNKDVMAQYINYLNSYTI